MLFSFARSLAVSLALAAMVLRALLPDGWMPAAGAAPFVICSVDGKHGDGKAPAPRSHAPCAFAAAAPLAPPSHADVAAASLSEVTHLAANFAAHRVAANSTYRPNAARAPPIFS